MRYTGRTGSVDEFLLLGQFVANEEYKKTKFSRYKRDNKK
jgi:thioredoxin-related protein